MFVLENQISFGYEDSNFLFDLLLSKLEGQEQLPEKIWISRKELETKLNMPQISSSHIHDILYRFVNIWITIDGEICPKRMSLFSNSEIEELEYGNWHLALSFSGAARENLTIPVLREIYEAISQPKLSTLSQQGNC